MVFLLAACGKSITEADILYYRLNSDVATLDPAFITDVNNAAIAAKLYQGLVSLDNALKIAPDLAERWEILEGGRLYRFYINSKRTFCNGRDVTAQDVKYSYERLLDPKTVSPNRWVLERVKSIKAVNSYIVDIRLKEPFAPFLAMLTMPAAYVVPREVVEKWAKGFAFRPCGTGAYVLDSWLPSREIRLRRREYPDNQPGISRGIVYRIIPEDLTAISEFELGNLDVIGLPGSAYVRFKRDPKWRDLIVESPSLNTYYLGMNTERPPFNNKDLRRAVALAIDRAKILDTFMDKRGRLADGIVPHPLRRWPINETIRYDPAESKRIIDNLGLRGHRVLMLITADQEVIDLAEIIQHYLKKVGIEVVLKAMEWSAFKEAINKGEADIFWLSWWADYPEAENFLYPLFHSSNKGIGGNRTRYSDPRVDTLLDKARATNDSAVSLYRQVEQIVLDDLPLIPFWHRADYILRQPWIEGLQPYPIYSMDRGLGLRKLK